jgi:two-component system response regulator HydG
MEDVPLLADHFLESLAESLPASRMNGHGPLQLSEDVVVALQRYDWPGNVRELENALERAAIVSKGHVIDLDALPSRIREPAPTAFVSDRPPSNPTLELVERAYILWVLDAEGGNKARAAEVLGIDPSTLYRKLNRYGVAS